MKHIINDSTDIKLFFSIDKCTDRLIITNVRSSVLKIENMTQRDKRHMLGISAQYAASQVLQDAWKKGAYVRTTLRKNSTSFVTGYESYWAYLEYAWEIQ